MSTQEPPLTPPTEPKMFKGYNHLRTCLSRIVPTQMQHAHVLRHQAMRKLRSGKF